MRSELAVISLEARKTRIFLQPNAPPKFHEQCPQTVMSLILKWMKDMCKKNVEALRHVCINMCTSMQCIFQMYLYIHIFDICTLKKQIYQLVKQK